MTLARLLLAGTLLAPLHALPTPADWVPMRWPWTDPASLELLANTPVNCVLIEYPDVAAGSQLTALVARAAEKSIVTLAVIRPAADPLESARAALAAKFHGIVLEGNFPAGAADRLRQGLSNTPIIELGLRRSMKLGSSAPILGTNQGVWPGIQIVENGAAKAGPSGSPWIDTNTGFIRGARAWGDAAIWLGNVPPAGEVVPVERYLQAICDSAITGGRWVIALDPDTANRLARREASALANWRRMTQYLRYFEEHREWRTFRTAGQLAIVQSVEDGSLISGGILDMISARHTPVRAVPPERVSPEALKGATMAVNVDDQSLTPEQREILKQFRIGSRATVLTGPPGWKDANTSDKTRITLEKDELKKLDDIWHDMQGMIGRRNLGVRLFNVSSMETNMLTSPDGKQAIVHLVNYSNYPIEAVAAHFLGEFKHARIFTPESAPRDLEVYKVDEGTGVDIDKVGVVATVLLE